MLGAWYVGAASWRRGFRSLIFLGLVAGLVGGVLIGALAGARRTESAYDRLLTASGGPHEVLFATADSARIESFLDQSPSVARYAPAAGLIGRRAPQEDWYSLYAPSKSPEIGHPVLERGRLPRPDRADEVYITLRTAQNTGLKLGDQINFDSYSRKQTSVVINNPWTPPAGARIAARVVGIVRDPTDAQLSQTIKIVYGTRAFAREHAGDATFTMLAIWLKGGPNDAPQFERELAQFAQTLPDNTIPFSATSSLDDANAANHSAHTVAIGLAIFTVVAALAGLIAMVQATRRYFARDDNDSRALLALGATRYDRTATSVIGMLPAIVIAPIAAVVIAYASSYAFPLGATRTLEPDPGFHADVFVLGVGAVAWLLVTIVLTATIAWGTSATRARPARAGSSGRAVDNASGATALPASIGVRFAFLPGARARTLRRTAIAGAVIAVVGVVGSSVFASSLHGLTATPARYGLAFDVSLEIPTVGSEPVLASLMGNPDLSAISEVRSGDVDVEGRTVTAYAVVPRKGSINAVVRSGRLPRSSQEIALGPKLLADAHKHVGDTVNITSGANTQRLKIVGTTLSPESQSNAFNAEAVLSPTALLHNSPNLGVEVLGRIRPGANHREVIDALDRQFPYAVSDESLPRAPGPIRNLEQIVRLPLVLALFFALLGAAAIGQAVFATTGERRRDLAVLRALGFTRRQVRVVVGAAASSFGMLALALGIPLGILAGKFGWAAVAKQVFVDPAMQIPALAVVAIGVGFLAFAGVVALLPARLALRRSPGAALRSE
jgi:predicted lysophospholipase L1 biosynthesis ABC-type transport system permease subunit